ncbi:hypothetical protein MH117_05155 [Paenibacillus sp. ACRRX]|uniref:hypothetical protein n=1 Tax=Paenibacillus sp. ACRRX TaxID=2918206 RepID=UPI001EF4651D|nr:hypothetical protein [Paenibacillus sp. ACRRX]MCG7406799.1 hypothetical protein [Paenibacillus sp. ACRRX]
MGVVQNKMKKDTDWIDIIGWVIEKGAIRFLCCTYSLVFLINKLLLNMHLGSHSIDKFLLVNYEMLIEPNIGTITTIAAVFVGIYVTVLSVLGSIKANSLIALLKGNDLSELFKFIRTGMISSFFIIFYSLFAVAVPSKFTQAFIFFLLIICMLLTALRFGVNILIIYSHDLKELAGNLDKEKEAIEKQNYLMIRLEEFLEQQEIERLKNSSLKKQKVINLNNKSEN